MWCFIGSDCGKIIRQLEYVDFRAIAKNVNVNNDKKLSMIIKRVMPTNSLFLRVFLLCLEFFLNFFKLSHSTNCLERNTFSILRYESNGCRLEKEKR